jgi:serine/threonine protein phosphatase 1
MPDDSVFAVLPEGRRTWAVASVYGEAGRLASLHRQIAQRMDPGDNLVYLGNFLGHGRDVGTTVNELLLFRRAVLARQAGLEGGEIVFLRGSQEEMWHKLLQIQFAPNPRQVFEWMIEHGVGATLEAYGGAIDEGRSAANRGAAVLSQWTNRLRARIRERDGHDRLLNVLRRAAYTGDGVILFVNAGIDPSRPLSQQSDSFWWGGRDFETMETPCCGFARVVRGADPRRRGVVVKDGLASIDGGCGFGGPLIAACFDASGDPAELIEA